MQLASKKNLMLNLISIGNINKNKNTQKQTNDLKRKKVSTRF